jgi:hypothetical protein
MKSTASKLGDEHWSNPRIPPRLLLLFVFPNDDVVFSCAGVRRVGH